MKAKDRLIFALDVKDMSEATDFAKSLNGIVGCFKVGLELFISQGPQVIKAIREHSDVDIFLDLKLHDIPATVKGAVGSAVNHGARYLTIHAGGGTDMMKAAIQGASGSQLKLLGVTVLTSMSPEDLAKQTGYRTSATLSQMVEARVELAKEAACHGIVCSGQEASRAKEIMGPYKLVVVPGIRPEWAKVKKDDQSRITTPAEAIQDGADMIVVGRPIRDAKDPKDAAQRIVDEIDETLNNRKA